MDGRLKPGAAVSRVLYFRRHAVLHGELPGMSVCVWRGTVPTCGLGGYIFPEGGIKTPRHLSHLDGVPRGQNKRRLSLRWLRL